MEGSTRPRSWIWEAIWMVTGDGRHSWVRIWRHLLSTVPISGTNLKTSGSRTHKVFNPLLELPAKLLESTLLARQLFHAHTLSKPSMGAKKLLHWGTRSLRRWRPILMNVIEMLDWRWRAAADRISTLFLIHDRDTTTNFKVRPRE